MRGADHLRSGQVIGNQRLSKVIHALREAADELRKRGVRRAGVFGSVSRGEDGPESDTDILIDIDTGVVGDIVGLLDLKTRIEEIVCREIPDTVVDVVSRTALKPGIRDAVENEVVYAF